MRVLIAEGVPLGHRLYFVRLVATEARSRGDSVVLSLSPAVVASEEYRSTLAPLGCEVIQEDQPTSPDVLVRSARECGSDVTIVLDADRIIGGLARRSRWKGPGSLRLLMLRSRMPERGADRLHRLRVRIKRLLLARVGRLPGIEVFHLVAPRPGADYRPEEVGDPVEWSASTEAVDSWRVRLADDLFWFGVLGVVTDRKNVPLVLEVLESSRSAGAAVGLLVAGQVAPDVMHAIRTASHGFPVVVEDRLLSEEELDAAVAAVDCVVLAHSNEGSSGILGKALWSGTRILAAGALSLKDACDAQPVGAEWARLTHDGIAGAVQRLLVAPAPVPQRLPSNLPDRLLRPAS